MCLRGEMFEERCGPRGRRRGMYTDREKSPDTCHEASVPLSPVLYLPDRFPPLLRDGVPERRRLDVPHSKIRSFPRAKGPILRSGNLVRFELLAQERNSVQRFEIGQRAARLRRAHQNSRFWHVQATNFPRQNRRYVLRHA